MKKSLIALALLAAAACAAAVGYVTQSIPILAAMPIALAGAVVVGNPFGLGEKAAHILFGLQIRTGAILAMTTLARDVARAKVLGTVNEFAVIAADIIFEGAAVGLVDATGHARPLTSVDRFAGFAESQADNSAGAAAAINVRVIESGKIQLAVTGAVITDMGQPVYATDDDTFVFNPAGGVFVGFVHRFVSAGIVIVAFDALNYRDPWAHKTVRETLAAAKTFDAEDSGKLFCVTDAGDADALTLPAIADGLSGITILAVGAFGTTAVTIDPAAVDKIHGPDITSADNKDLILTKATQRRGDFVTLDFGDADGYAVTEMRGSWAREA